MAEEVVMPQMGAEMEEGTVVRWLKQPGDRVERGDIIAEIETDKATVEMDAYVSGTFLKAVVEEGTTVPVGQVIAYIGEENEQTPEGGGGQPSPVQSEAPAAPSDNGSAAPGGRVTEQPGGYGGREAPVVAGEQRSTNGVREAQTNQSAAESERATVTAAQASESMRAERTASAADVRDPARPEARDTVPTRAASPLAPAASASSGSGVTGRQRLRASPVARNIAEELGIDLNEVPGTGPGGRIMRHDVESVARQRSSTQVQGEEARAPAPPRAPTPIRPAATQEQPAPRAERAATPAASAAPEPAPAAPPPWSQGTPGDEVEPLTRMRQAIARRMTTAKREMPHYYVAMSVDMHEAANFRRQINENLEQADRISINDMILKACAVALEKHPRFNASFNESGITVHQAINIGIAVALEDGLVVPAVLDCRGKSLGALSRAARDVADRARGGKLRPAELNDGTFTVSNLGMYGVETLIAIIQPGQSAILGVGRMEERAVVRDGQVVPRQMMTIALSADHRVTDGAMGAQFTAEIKALLENPSRLVL